MAFLHLPGGGIRTSASASQRLHILANFTILGRFAVVWSLQKENFYEIRAPPSIGND